MHIEGIICESHDSHLLCSEAEMLINLSVTTEGDFIDCK